MPKTSTNDRTRQIEELAERDGRYKKEAYFFLYWALDHTLNKLKAPRHVTGQELLRGISEYGRKQYGPMTKLVLEYWGIIRTEDFGNMVFNLVDTVMMGKTEEDRIEDFQDVYDFDEEFG